ncbi:MAG: nitrous oxide-stimulated promoter family protein [Burkholderiales bacterium]
MRKPARRRAECTTRHAIPRLARELATIRAMVTLYCHAHHGQDDGLCLECDALP